jgi:type IV secretory pathway VirB4 component
MTLESLVAARCDWNFNHDVISKFKKVSARTQSALMNHLKKEGQIASNLSEVNKNEEVERLAESIEQFEESLFDVELFVKIEAPNEVVLRERIKIVSQSLEAAFGSEYTETFGSYPTYLASFPGSSLHVSFKELSSGLLYYTPIFAPQSYLQQSHKAWSMRMHRKGDHLDSVELISNHHQSGNTMIIGPKGSGKSVLCGLITESLMNDPNVKIIKMDVGSSYIRECAKLGGVHFNLNINEPSGLNPLAVLASTPHDLEIADIVSDFIEVLISKESLGTFGISDEERAILDRIVIAYSESRPKAPSIDDFLHFSSGRIPNQILLERWSRGGMYENIFKRPEGAEDQRKFRYRYFDFKSVNNATAVMAEYNSDVAISGRNGPRIFLFCDETTEFLNYCAPFFITTVKNSRKYGHSTILINQESDPFYVRDRKGELTTSLFINTDHHFLFASPPDEGEVEKFKARHRLTGVNLEGIKRLTYQKGQFSEVFYKTRLGGQTLKIQLTTEEYWLLTTDKEDYDKLHKLKEIGFTDEEAIRCLSELHSSLY